MEKVKKEKKKKIGFLSTYSILFIILIVAGVLTHFIPAGEYSTLKYDKESSSFIISTGTDGVKSAKPASQQILDDLGFNLKVEDFKDGNITGELSIPDTYKSAQQSGQGIFDIIKAPINGISATVEIVIFLLMIGGTIGVVNAMNVFDMGMNALARASKNKEQIIIVVVTALIAFGGTTFGLCEETIPFYAILIPVFVAAGYDAMTGFATIFCGSCIGSMFSTVNAFSVVVASNAAGVNFRSGIIHRSIGLILAVAIAVIFIIRYALKVKKSNTTNALKMESKKQVKDSLTKEKAKEYAEFSPRHKAVLILFAVVFVIMVVGIVALKWSFLEMSALFLVSGIILGIVGGMGEKSIVKSFISGAADLVGVALVVGLARSINLVLRDGKVVDTVLESMAGFIKGMNPILFVIVAMFLFMVLGCVINSSSGLAMLSIPIIAPLADSIGIPREVVISAYIYGLGIASFFTPTGMVFVCLEVVGLEFKKWIKFGLPLMGMLTLLAIVMLIVQIYV